jgi:transposase
MGRRTGRPGRSPLAWGSIASSCGGCGPITVLPPGALRRSNSPTTPTSRRSSWTSLACTWIRQRGRWCSPLMRRPKCRHWIARNRSLPMRRGRAETMTHDYKRNGTTDLFAALNVATGEVAYDFADRHTGADVLRFFRQIDRQVPRGLDIHVVLDNLSAHKAPEVTAWLAKPRQKRWHLHFTPTSSSWLNLVEQWFRELTERRLKRGSFMSLEHLTTAITIWADAWNSDPKPFVWRAAAEQIIEKVARGRDALNRNTKSVSDH